MLAVLDRGDGSHGDAGSAALTRRLAELDTAALRTVQFAAVLGPQVDPAALATVVGGVPNDLLTHIEAAAASGVLVPDGDHYVFRHDLYRAAVLSTVTRPARSLLHLHAARSLARAGAPVLDVAEHYAQGTRPGDREAVRWLHDAALDIVAAAPAGALRLVDVALELAGPAPPDDLVLVRVRALAGTGRTAEADLLGRSLLRDGLAAATEAPLRRELGFTALMRGHAAECVTEIERCAELTAAPGPCLR